jgi:basic amino acid/polyamine antiporter, APA family
VEARRHALTPTQPPTRLARRLGTRDAVVVGLGAMLGAGVFVAFGPAARAAGSGVLVALALAGFVAFCNATSSAQLAARHPASGGTYVYGRERLGRFWGFLAGWGFVVGKLASCAAMALTVGYYVAPSAARPLAVAAVAAVTAVNLAGVEKTAWTTRVIVAVVVGALAAVVAAVLLGGEADAARLRPLLGDGGAYGLLQAAGLLFFAFAGYARIATLGEEVRDPQRTIPRAIPLALGIVLVVYAVVGAAVLGALGAEQLAAATAPLAAAVEAGSLAELAPAAKVGAAVASVGVLLSLEAGVSRTAFAMAANRELPRWLDAVHPRTRVPHRAELAVAAVVAAAAASVDLRSAIGFSSFAVLVYYAITNASALRLAAAERRWPRALGWAGLAGCLVLAFALPLGAVAAGAATLAAGAAVYGVLVRRT